MATFGSAPRCRRTLVGAALLLAAVTVGFVVWWMPLTPASNATTAPTPPPAVPAEIVTVAQRDVPIYLSGIGTVQAFNSVTVTSRVDGMLQKIAFTEGQTVKAGDLLAQIDPRPFQATLDQAVAKKAQDEAQLTNAKLDLQRFAKLIKRQFAPVQQLEAQQALVAELEAQIRGDQASIEAAQTQLGYATIASPIDGRTGIRLVDQGNIVHATDTTGLVVVTQLQPISVVFTLPEQDMAAVQPAMAAGAVEVIATSRDGHQPPAKGTLAVLDNQINQATGTIRLKGTFPNQDGALWPGEFVDVRLLAETEHNVLTVPSTVLQRGPGGYYAYGVGADSQIVMRPLEVGQIADGIAVIRAGLSGGEPVVASGQYRLAPGTRVAPQAAP